jgi:chromosomal replication initiator protein
VLAWRSLVSKLLLEYRLSMPNEKRPAKEIILEVLEMFPGVNFREVQGPARNRNVVRARQVAMYEVSKQRPDLSSPVIGSIFGDRDHTTVLHAVSKIKAMKEAGEPLHFPNEHF